mgnify:CR=1 FL=1
MSDHSITSDGIVLACPDCDSSSVSVVIGKGAISDATHSNDYRCRDCGATFDEPVERERQTSSGGIGYLAGRLDEMDADEIGEPEQCDDELVTDGGTREHHERWVAAGQPEAMAAETVDSGECGYNDCNSEADYRVQLDDDNRTTFLCCDDCSRENHIWVRENELLDNEVID